MNSPNTTGSGVQSDGLLSGGELRRNRRGNAANDDLEKIPNFCIIVQGTPAPQGSKSRGRNGQMFEASKKVKPWRMAVWAEALTSMLHRKPFTGPVAVHVTFLLARPKVPKFPAPAVKPDLDKLQRSTFDALKTAGVYLDDCQIVEVRAIKRYSSRDEATGALIEVRAL